MNKIGTSQYFCWHNKWVSAVQLESYVPKL
jgi:hypothetical protein